MTGHAGYERKGYDIVCSALSILSQNTVFSIIELTGVNKKDLNLVNEPNIPKLAIMLNNTDDKDVDLLLKSYKLGIEILKKSYPKYIALEYREVQ